LLRNTFALGCGFFLEVGGILSDNKAVFISNVEKHQENIFSRFQLEGNLHLELFLASSCIPSNCSDSCIPVISARSWLLTNAKPLNISSNIAKRSVDARTRKDDPPKVSSHHLIFLSTQ
jgi:hypothetical protein